MTRAAIRLKGLFVPPAGKRRQRVGGWSSLSGFFILALALLILGAPVAGPADSKESDPLVNDIAKCIREGNAEALSKYFNQSLEISLPGRDDVFSKTQAQQVVTDFFKKNKPSAFQIQHQSGPAEARFIIGGLTAATGNFRVYFLLKTQAGRTTIHLLKFEKD